MDHLPAETVWEKTASAPRGGWTGIGQRTMNHHSPEGLW